MPKSLQTFFGTDTEMSWGQSVLGPKCLVIKISPSADNGRALMDVMPQRPALQAVVFDFESSLWSAVTKVLPKCPEAEVSRHQNITEADNGRPLTLVAAAVLYLNLRHAQRSFLLTKLRTNKAIKTSNIKVCPTSTIYVEMTSKTHKEY